jgi:two-component system, cell cycle sensor histidine kinase and response regulator CckA
MNALSAIALSSLAIYGWVFTRGRAARFFAFIVSLCALLAWLYASQIYVADVGQKILMARLLFVPLALIPWAWFMFAFQHSNGRFRFSPPRALFAGVIPALTVFLAVTGIHSEWLRTFRLAPGAAVLAFDNGPWFSIHLFYSYALGIASLVFMFASLQKSKGERRPQTIVLMVSMVFPGLVDFLFQIGVRPVAGFSFLSVSLFLSSIISALAVYGTRFFALLPVARSLVFDSLEEAVLVVDSESRICDYNPAAAQLFGTATADRASVRRLPPPWGESLGALLDPQKPHGQSRLRPTKGGAEYEVSVSPVNDGVGRFRGHCIMVRDVGPRAEMEMKLRDSDEKLRRFFEQATVAFALTDEQGRIVEFNPAAQKLTGIERAKALGVFAWELQATLVSNVSGEKARVGAQAMLARALQEGTSAGPFEGRMVGPDGEERFFEQTFFQIRTNNGYCLGTTAQDVTGRRRDEESIRRTEAAVRDSRQMLQLVLDLIPQSIFWKSSSSVYIGCNRVFARWTGRSDPRKVVGMTDADMPWAKDAPLYVDIDAEILRFGNPRIDYVQEMATTEGNRRQVRLSKLPLKNTQGEVLGVVGIAEDISVWIKSEEERAFLSTAIEKAVENVVITDAAGAIQYVNPGFLSNYGHSREEVIGNNPRILKSGKHSAEFYRDLWSTIASGKVWHGRFFNVRKDGSPLIEEAIISPVLDANGGASHFVKVARNVTYEVDLEERFRQAQKMEAIGRLAGGVAHDFNNILTVISGYSEILGREIGRDGAWQEELGAIIDAAARASALTGQLLAFSRKQKLQPQVIDLNAVVRGIEKMLRRLIGEDIDFATDLESPPGNIFVDKGQIEQVILNLAVNARDAMPKGGRLDVRTRRIRHGAAAQEKHPTVKPGEYAMLEVADTGTGMTDQVKAHLFEPFFTTKSEHKGTGLGLATVYGIVTQSGGSIDVESTLGEGTRFQILFPLMKEADRTQPRFELTSAPAWGNEKILLVEDDPAIRTLLRRSLREHGFVAIEAPDPSRALEVFRAAPASFQLLLTDVIMPDLSGPKLAEMLRRENPALKVLFISGYTANETTEHGVLGSEINLLQKPFSMQELARRVRETLDRD